MTSGIYVIVCKSTGDTYVGSTSDFEKRVAVHMSNLRLGKVSPKWKHLVSEYGISSFKFSVIENVTDTKLLRVREQAWINILCPSLNEIISHTNNAEFIPPKTSHARQRILDLIEEVVAKSNEKVTLTSILSKHGYSRQTYYMVLAGTGTYSWLQEDYPEILEKLQKLKGKTARP